MPSYRFRSRAVAPLAVGLCALAAFTASASAATVSTAPCIVDLGVVRSLPITGSGFAANAFVSLNYNSAANPTVQSLTGIAANSLGGFGTNAFPASFNSFKTVDQTFNLIATDGTNSATTKFRQVRFGASAKPNKGRPKRRVRYTARGFASGKSVYLHFRFSGKTRRTVKLGTAHAPCGNTTRKLSLLPARVRYGTWTVYVDQKRKYSKKTLLQAKGSLQIFRTFS